MRTLAHLLADQSGTMAIETVIVAPVLLIMALGGVEAGSMVARENELQSAAAEALNIVQANPPKTQAQRDTVRDIMKVSTGITNNANATVTEIYRCGTAAAFVTATSSCVSTDAVSFYIRITLKDTYTPAWTQFGVGTAVNYNLVRTVQIS